MVYGKTIYEQAQLADFYSIPLFDKQFHGYSDIEIQKIQKDNDIIGNFSKNTI